MWGSSFWQTSKNLGQAVSDATSNANVAAVGDAFSFIKKAATEQLVGGSEGKLDPHELGMYFITPRIIVMGFPSEKWIQGGTLVNHVSLWLKNKHPGRFMVWNLSEKKYDYSKFQDNVLDFTFAGYPAPPLALVFSMCDSLHGWLNADEKNVAVVHCQTCTGRSVTALAVYLSWAGLLATPQKALAHIAKAMEADKKDIVIPTQRRYIEHYAQLLEGDVPSDDMIMLSRVIINGIPHFETDGRCRPYLQIFKDAKLLFTSTGRSGEDSNSNSKSTESDLRWYRKEDSSILFPVGITLDGDVLIRIRHYSSAGRRITMLRLGFHTGYITPGNKRFAKKDLDGACDNNRFNDDFFMDVIFQPALDPKNGQPHKNTLGASYWKQVSQRKATTAPDLTSGHSSFSLGGEGGEGGGGDDEGHTLSNMMIDEEKQRRTRKKSKQSTRVIPIAMPVGHIDTSSSSSPTQTLIPHSQFSNQQHVINTVASTVTVEPRTGAHKDTTGDDKDQASYDELAAYVKGLGTLAQDTGTISDSEADSDGDLLEELHRIQGSTETSNHLKGDDDDGDGDGDYDDEEDGLDLEAALRELADDNDAHGNDHENAYGNDDDAQDSGDSGDSGGDADDDALLAALMEAELNQDDDDDDLP